MGKKEPKKTDITIGKVVNTINKRNVSTYEAIVPKIKNNNKDNISSKKKN